MKTPLSLALVLALLATGAQAASLTPSKLHLLDASEASLDPIQHGKTDLFLLGLGLVAGGLVLLGGAGFALLYVCREGTSCNSQTTTYVGYGLAAPGILPLAAGLIIIYLFTGKGTHGSTEAPSLKPKWALALVPVAGGGLIGATGSF